MTTHPNLYDQKLLDDDRARSEIADVSLVDIMIKNWTNDMARRIDDEILVQSKGELRKLAMSALGYTTADMDDYSYESWNNETLVKRCMDIANQWLALKNTPAESPHNADESELKVENLSALLKKIFRWANRRGADEAITLILDLEPKCQHLLTPNQILRTEDMAERSSAKYTKQPQRSECKSDHEYFFRCAAYYRYEALMTGEPASTEGES